LKIIIVIGINALPLIFWVFICISLPWNPCYCPLFRRCRWQILHQIGWKAIPWFGNPAGGLV